MKKTHLIFLPLVLLLFLTHFHDSRSFKRDLINYDDVEFIEPLKSLDGPGEYFEKRILAKDAYGFPLRDLSFVIDFKLSELLGWNTFWVTNFILYCLVLLILLRLFGDVFPDSRWWPIALISLLALHPIHVEMIQWASNRKHLLVAVLLAWGTRRVWQVHQLKTKVTLKNWSEFFAYYLLAWLCWPSAVLWIFWPLSLFFKQMTVRNRALVFGAALLISCAGVRWTMNQNASYEDSGEAAIQIGHALSISLQSLGRGLFNALFPYKVAPYYTFNSPLNWAGAILLAAGLVLLVKFKRKRKITWGSSPAFQFLVLSALLFIPNSLVFLGYYEFVWADRYLYTPLPYFMVSVGLMVAPILKAKPTLSRGLAWMLMGMMGAYTWLSWSLPSAWQTDRALFNRCAAVEASPKCIYLAVEKNYDQTGCRDLNPLFKVAREASAVTKVDFGFSSQLPLYESICISQMRPTAEQKFAELESLKSIYKVTESLAVGEVWVHIQLQDLDAALEAAKKTYLNRKRPFSDVSPKVINVIRGQLEALCELSGSSPCYQELNSFKDRTKGAPPNPKQVTWAKNRTMEAYFTGH